jgi:hypothetical protein
VNEKADANASAFFFGVSRLLAQWFEQGAFICTSAA